MPRFRLVLASALFLLPASSAAAQQSRPTVAEARAFLARVDATLDSLSIRQARADWVNSTYITDDTEIMAGEAKTAYSLAVLRLVAEAKRFDGLTLPADVARQLLLLKLALAAPPPPDAAKAGELTRLQVGMESTYGKGTYCRPARSGERGDATGQLCRQLGDLTRLLATSRDADALLDAWSGWRTVSPPMKDQYARFVALANEGARSLGFADAGAMWRSGYDMPPEAFTGELDRLWQQVRPLYVALHAYVRHRLVRQYGATVVSPTGPIPAHLLGNMWAQEWGNIYDVVAPPSVGAGEKVDITSLLRAREIDARGMVRYGEGFFSSLGLAPLPETFWARSMLTKPADRDVVCHASAWDVDNRDDIRIKMCIEITGEDFVTVHHELGHNYYQRAYRNQPYLFKGGANDGFHEAIGDAIALSITPEYLQRVGLLTEVPPAANDIPLLLRQALDKVAFLPFGLLIDQWRWRVFAGQVTPAEYNRAWWDLRREYQGVAPPAPRPADAFDPGAKYHVPGNTPYTRYFLARVLQFQFHRALCQAAGETGPLHRCSIYGNTAAGAKLRAVLEAGLSKPWQETLEQLTGTREMDATAMMDYFAPLKAWLDEQNRGVPVGW